MKNNQNTTDFSDITRKKISSFRNFLVLFFVKTQKSSFDVFTFLKAKNEKLEIVFANIRV